MLPKNILMPNLEGKSADEKIRILQETILSMQKQINYALKNIDTDNMSETVASAIESVQAENSGLNRKVTQDEFTTYVLQMADVFKVIAEKQKNIYSGEYEPVAQEGTQFGISDLWIRNIVSKTCQMLVDGYTGQQLLDNFTCDDILNGSSSIYSWDGIRWILSYNSAAVTKLATEIQQNAEQIALKASQESVNAQGQTIATVQAQQTIQAGQITSKAAQSTVDAQGTRLSSAEASILLNAQQILQRVEKSGIISSINQSAEAIKIQAALIALEGIITANGNFKILTDGSMDAAGKLRAGNWVFDDEGATFTDNGTTLFRIMMDAVDGAFVSADLTKSLVLMGRQMCFYNAATTGSVTLGQDVDSGYVQQCFYPAQTRTGNLGTPSHIWDTASIRAVFRESEGGLSSRKIKKGIRELKSVSKIVDALKAVTFIYRGDPRQKRHYGMIYEETEKVDPLLCVQLRDNDTNPRNFGIDYSSMTVLLLKEVQDLRKRVAVLEKKGA